MALINTNDTHNPNLTRNSSTTSSSASSVGYKHPIVPSRSETEAVIEALFNPTIFKPSPAAIPHTSSPDPYTTGANKLKEVSTPRPRDGPRRNAGDEYSDGEDSDAPESQHSEKRSSTSESHSGSRSPVHWRHGSLHSQQRMALDIALDMNQRKDREETTRAVWRKGDGWEFVEFPNGARGVKRAPHRSGTGESAATDMSTTSDPSFASNSTVSGTDPRSFAISPATSPSRPVLPPINTKGKKLRKGSANDADGKEEFHPLGRRATAPARGGGIAAALASAGKMSADLGGRLGSSDAVPPEVPARTLGVPRSPDTTDGPLASGQVTPTPETIGEKSQAALAQV